MPTTAPTVILAPDALSTLTNLILAITGLITVLWGIAKALRNSESAKADAGEAKVMAAANSAQIQGMQQTLHAVALATPAPASPPPDRPGPVTPTSMDNARLTQQRES